MQGSQPPTLAMMQPADMEAVLEVERAAYSSGWPATAFERELTQNRMARYVVLREAPGERIVGFGGLWLMVDEAHVVTVAVLPDLRRRGYGRALVAEALRAAKAEGGRLALLEVRASNTPARELYRSVGFEDVRLRPRYYADGEDGVEMHAPL